MPRAPKEPTARNPRVRRAVSATLNTPERRPDAQRTRRKNSDLGQLMSVSVIGTGELTIYKKFHRRLNPTEKLICLMNASLVGAVKNKFLTRLIITLSLTSRLPGTPG
ncbi:hypothetical protein EVAR_101310_1 [Eumeta japonica]|uniref:Uncharacterized protein n=1 Tax=Eumeta variegata TaxID=151549 RepID=A0A4C2ABD2_EUMVA|nr:hypothetical protein EVAR_101310_1 [Eumeta japonica]